MGNNVSDTTKATLKEKRYRYIEAMMKREPDTDINKGDLFCEDQDEWSYIDAKDYVFPFENVVLEGGGSKGGAYWGALKFLEELGMLPKIKRLAGSSVGSIAAACIAVGYTATEFIESYFDQDVKELLCDSAWFDIIPNLLSHFGWHRGDNFDKWLGEVITRKTGSADITFEEVFQLFGRELCVVVTNLNLMRTEYCHPKTTPDMPIRLAVRMSMSIPGLFAAKHVNLHGEKDVFVDGGIICNFPINCFDGWFLSMAEEDNFFKRLHGHSKSMTSVYENRFEEENLNLKTLGFIVFTENESDLMRTAMEEKLPSAVPVKPAKDTRLYKKWAKKKAEDRKAEIVHEKLLVAANAFMKVLQKHNLDNNNAIDRAELEEVIKDESFSKTHAELLFGKEMDIGVFDLLDYDKDGQIHYSEIVAFLEDTGIFLHNRYFGYKRSNILNINSFVLSVMETCLLNMKRVHFKPRDVDRTVGINTGYVDTADFILEREDKNFLLERGYNTCKSFLQRFALDNKLEKKEKPGDE